MAEYQQSFSDGQKTFATSLLGSHNVAFWDVATGEKSNLSIAVNRCTVLRFIKNLSSSVGRTTTAHDIMSPEKRAKKRKRKRSEGQDAACTKLNDAEHGSCASGILAVGNEDGDIELINPSTAQTTAKLKDHAESVTDICCANETATKIFSCSVDRNIIEWDLNHFTIKKKWRSHKTSVHSICLCDDDRSLLSAARTIKMWSLDTYQLLREFAGHSTEILQMLSLPSSLLHLARQTSNTSSDSDSSHTKKSSSSAAYFLSAAAHDRYIYAWKSEDPNNNDSSSSSSSSTALASFLLPDNVKLMELSEVRPSSQLVLGALTTAGQLQLFYLSLNGRRKKPSRPATTITVGSKQAKDHMLHIISFTFQHVSPQATDIIIVYGSPIAPAFDRLSWETIQDGPSVLLMRDDPTRTVVSREADVTKTRLPHVNETIVRLVNQGDNTAVSLPTLSASSLSKSKRLKTGDSVLDIPFNERLRLIGLSEKQKSKGDSPPDVGSMAILLSQALQSRQQSSLNFVLQLTDDKIIGQTVRQLPLNMLVPLLEELRKRLGGHAQVAKTSAKWLRSVVTHRYSYLSTFPQVIQSFGEVWKLTKNRLMNDTPVSQLLGRLNFVTNIINERVDEETGLLEPQPAAIFEEDSSDEEIDFELNLSSVEADATAAETIMSSGAEEENYDSNDEEDVDDSGEENDGEAENSDAEEEGANGESEEEDDYESS